MWRVSARASAAPTPSIRYLVTPHLHIPQFRSCVGWSLSVAHTIVLCSHHYPLGLPSWGWWMASPRHLSPPALLAGSPPSSPAHTLLGTVACVHRARGSPALALLWPTWLAPFFSRQPLRSAPLGGRGPCGAPRVAFLAGTLACFRQPRRCCTRRRPGRWGARWRYARP